MIALTYIVILLLCYGIYNLFCYFRMLPTARSSRNLRRIQRKGRRLCHNAFILGLAEKIVKKWELEWDGSDTLDAILTYNGIYHSAAVYFISLSLSAVCGLLLCLPMLFIYMQGFYVLAIGVLLFVSGDFLLLLFRYQGHIAALKRELPLLGLLARRYFKTQTEVSGYLELARKVSDDDWKDIWRELLLCGESVPEAIERGRQSWRDKWLIRFAGGFLSEEKDKYFKDFYKELGKERTEQREKRLQRICRWAGLLPGVLILCLILILVWLFT